MNAWIAIALATMSWLAPVNAAKPGVNTPSVAMEKRVIRRPFVRPPQRPALPPGLRAQLRTMVQSVMQLERNATRIERRNPQQAWRMREQAEAIRDRVAMTCSRYQPPCP